MKPLNYQGKVSERYSVTRDGKVFSGGKELAIQVFRHGYCYVWLGKEFGSKYHLLHRLIASTFIDPEIHLGDMTVNHKDYNKENNCLDNLEVITASENSRHRNLKYKPHNQKAVCELSNGKVIGIWSSATEASREVNISQTGISKSIRENKPIWGRVFTLYKGSETIERLGE